MSVTTTEWAKITKMINDAINANNSAPVLKASSFAVGETIELTKTVIDSITNSVTVTPPTNLVSPVLETAWSEGRVIITPGYSLTAGAGQYGGLLRYNGGYNFQNKLYTLSALVKKDNWDFIGFRIDGGTNADVYPFVNLSNLSVNNLGLSGITLKAVADINGWIKLTYSLNVIAGIKTMDIALVNNVGESYYGFAGTEKVFISNVTLT